MADFLSRFDHNARFNLFLVLGPRKADELKSNFLTQSTIPLVDIGKALAQHLSLADPSVKMVIRAPEIVEDIVTLSAVEIQGGKRAVALCNFGILNEPDLGLNAGKILADLSKQIIILLLWNGNYQGDGILAWNSKKGAARIDLSNASPQVIDLNHEI